MTQEREEVEKLAEWAEALGTFDGARTTATWTKALEVLGDDDGGGDPLQLAAHAYADALDEAEDARRNDARPDADKVRKAREDYRRALEAARPLWPAKWDGKAPPPRLWMVNDWLSPGCVTVLAGSGGAGKSRLALQLAAAVASGGDEGGHWIAGEHAPLLGLAADDEGAPVLYASWEDDAPEVFRRLDSIRSDATPWVTDQMQFKYVDMTAHGPTWGPPEGKHIATVAALLEGGRKLRQYAANHKVKLLVLDPLAACYVGSENDRSLVRSFMASWDGWARDNECVVLLLAHESKSSDGGPSGSTDWTNAARAVWTLRKEPRGKKLGRNKPDYRPLCWKLDLVKSNYGPAQDALLMGWDSAEGLRWQVLEPWEEEDYDDGL